MLQNSTLINTINLFKPMKLLSFKLLKVIIAEIFPNQILLLYNKFVVQQILFSL